jgi:hypothetical protein
MDDEMREKLKQLEKEFGFDQWGKTEEHQIEHPMMKSQKELLSKLGALLNLQLGEDTEKVRELREKLNRLKYGGGR